MKSRLRKKRYIKRILLLILIIILGFFVFDLYKYQHEKNKFNIVLRYGVEEDVNLILFKYSGKPKNVLNTLNDTFVRELVNKGKAKTKLSLTKSEMKGIETYITEKSIMSYPDKITDETKMDSSIMKSYLIIYLRGHKKTIEWDNLGSGKNYTKEMKNQVKNLDQLELRIIEIIENKKEFK
ncbi:hypothetical protein K9O30_18125 [Clostridium bowmanii]|uniref:hypothetical protein n=1 Tax=Clostridium bowmanii TaxID=132925 RepID=UPI001C0D0DF8|nr:hypothetical protein [Clostridium bowmanii]MBU3191425.1 hypothetical protein [Clostridium bowmanii]MCA1075603.1 hypothetical protein [Clostridium bowmanii]